MIQEIINKGEDQTHSFVEGVSDEIAIVQLLTAFANSSGGSLFIGINKKGKVIGCFPDQVLEDIIYYINKYTKPNLNFTSKSHQLAHKFVLEIIIPKSEHPYQALDTNLKSDYYIRCNTTTLKANKIIRRFLYLKFKDELKPSINNVQLISFIALRTTGITLSQLYSSQIDSKKNIDESLAVLLLNQLVRFEFIDNQCYYFANKS